MKAIYNVNIKENRFKMYSMWYYTLASLAKMYGGKGRCWRCGRRKAGFAHIWWDSVQGKKFWQKRHWQILQRLKCKLFFAPHVYCGTWFNGSEEKENIVNLWFC